jgi:tetratricopeptide (TPR) repeat protein
VGISSVEVTNEKCFDETKELIFHAQGLNADMQYSLRVVLFEREKAIAVSIRNFYVAGIRGVGEQVVTIQTAVQVALSYQNAGDTAQAEKIYKSILSVVPQYPDALHLLGLVFHQQGATETAIAYIEKALQTTTTSFEGFHNSLGECYRVLGRLEDATAQFEKALSLNPAYLSSIFNLGLVSQAKGQFEEAIDRFRVVNSQGSVDGPHKEIVLKSKVRECDLVNVVGRVNEAIACWRDGAQVYPTEDIFYNELGTLIL